MLVAFLTGCDHKKGTLLFTAINRNVSGIDFENTITETEQINLITNEYTYMGGGVGAGDFNNDGLVDLFFTANQTTCRLYINRGNLEFEEVTKSAGLSTTQWCTGVSVVDINNDGWQDIYISVSGPFEAARRQNLLYINNRNLTFTEMAGVYGLDDKTHSTQAVFLDYDKDGWLDMFLLTHQMQGESMNKVLPKDLSGNSPRNDQLYHNEGINVKTGHPYFKNVTIKSGIRDDGYGLGVAVSDFNKDNWPDIYVANDYIGNDCMWLNQKNGTFANIISRSLNHQSYSSMGSDAADINNDGLPDVITLDMMPEDNERKKMMYSILTNERHEMEKYLRYEPSYMHNTLQLHRGMVNINDTVFPVFSDIANYAGVAETDWSWSVLAADFDNDGYKDLHVTNGMGRDMINSDFVAFRSSAPSTYDRTKLLLDELNTFGSVPLSNYLFLNNHNYFFTNKADEAGLGEKAISNGAAYADLDNDGDLDLAINNINGKAFLFSNNSIQQKKPNANFLSFQLRGAANNLDGVGTVIRLFIKDRVILLEQNPVRGYLSTVDKRLFTGLGKTTVVDSIQVVWPNDSMQSLKNITANQVLRLEQKNALEKWVPAEMTSVLFYNYTKESGIDFKHTDPFFFDYDFQRLLPQKFSSQGPGVAVGDINNDGLQDFFVGNGYNVKGMLFTQNNDGSFSSKQLETGDKFEEDTGCLFFDADGDKDEDLFVTSGTNEFPKGSPYYLPRLYINDGKGNFSRNKYAVPQHLTGVTCVAKASDFDLDGDLDLFLGGRIASGAYPSPPPSYLLQNNKGIFTDVTQTFCPALSNLGMVTDAEWIDVDGDKVPELFITGEWMPIKVFKKQANSFVETTGKNGLSSLSGLWRSIVSADLDRDGDLDFVAGNIGLNNKFHFDSTYPLNMWYADLDANGSNDPVMGYYIPTGKGDRELFPAMGLDEIAMQVPSIKKKYLLHKEFSKATLADVFGAVQPAKLIANEAASCWFENDGNGMFKKHALPAEAQFAPVNCMLVNDFNKDGSPDILLAGNEYGAEVMTGQYDAGYGLLLLGTTNKTFVTLPLSGSGFFLRGDTRCMRSIVVNNELVILAAINNSALQVFKTRKE